MNDRCKEVYDYIDDYVTTHHYAPSYQEIADACSIPSKSTVSHILNILENEGCITNDGKPRTIVIIKKYE